MDLCDISQVKALLARHGFHFSKAKGQNFLTQDWVPRRIAAEAGIGAECGVVEIGPGIGALTQQLCLRAKKVVAVEVDLSLQPLLRETLSEFDNLDLVFADVLKTDLSALVQEHLTGMQAVACANLPYYITSPVLAALLECRRFSSVTVMVQKEVAQRICAAAGTPEYSAFTVFCNYYAAPQLLFEVPPDCFLPRPKVTSAVLRLQTRTAPPCELFSEEVFFRVVKASFAQRRKTLCNGLSAGLPELSKPQAAEILAAVGLPPSVRGETLDLGGFAAVANEICRRLGDV